jgi:tetratricopeptide (TPR) repeat protein
MTDVLPGLAQEAREHLDSLSFIDLRWGVDTSSLETEESARKVLSVCLDEIDKSKPYMIVLLGERYGWVPEASLLSGAADAKDFSIDDDFKSVTALEIEYGALSGRGQLSRCLFYVREPLDRSGMTQEEAAVYGPESDRHAQKLAALRHKIEARTGQAIKTYKLGYDAQTKKLTGLDGFCEMVSADLRQMLDAEWKKAASLDGNARAIAASWLFMQEKAAGFSALHDLCGTYKQKILSDGVSLFLLKGESGSGKSTIIAKLSADLVRDGVLVVPFVCGAEGCYGTDDLLSQLIFFLENELGEPHDGRESTFVDLRNRFAYLCNVFGEKQVQKTLAIAVDGLESLFGKGAKTFDWMPAVLPPNIKVISCCTDDAGVSVPLVLEGKSAVEQCAPLSAQERPAVVNGILASAHKQLNSELVKKICALRSASSPLYLSLILQRLMMFNSQDFGVIAQKGNDMAAINGYLANIVETAPAGVQELCAAVVQEAGERIEQKLCGTVVHLLAWSKRGLREKDMEAIFIREGIPFNSLDFARLMKYMHPYFMAHGDGRIDFSHKLIRSGILGTMDDREKSRICRMIQAYVKTLPQDDPVCAEETVRCSWYIKEIQAIAEYIGTLDFSKMTNAPAPSLWFVALVTVQDKPNLWKMVESLGAYEHGGRCAIILYKNLPRYIGSSAKSQEMLRKLLEKLENNILQQYRKGTAGVSDLMGVRLKTADSYMLAGKNDAAVEAFLNCGRDVRPEDLSSKEYLSKKTHSLRRACEIFSGRRDFGRVIEVCGQAEEIQRRLAEEYGDLHTVNLANTLDQLVEAYSQNGNTKEAEEKVKESIEIREKILSQTPLAKNKRNLAITYDMAANLFAMQGKKEERVGYCNRATALREEAVQEIRSYSMLRELGISYSNLALAEIFAGEGVSACAHVPKALSLFQGLVQKMNTPQAKDDLGDALRVYAMALQLTGDHLRAKEMIQASVSVFEDLKNADEKTYAPLLLFSQSLQEQIDNNVSPEEILSAGNRAVYGNAEMEFVHAQKFLSTDPQRAITYYEKGISILRNIAGFDPTTKNRDFLATWCNQAAVALKGYPEAQNKYWKECSAIWIDIYENAADKALKKEFKKKYKYSKMLRFLNP